MAGRWLAQLDLTPGAISPVIGHTVNLASRLCDRAEKWQILVSDPFCLHLPREIQQFFARTEPMEFKHVSR